MVNYILFIHILCIIQERKRDCCVIYSNRKLQVKDDKQISIILIIPTNPYCMSVIVPKRYHALRKYKLQKFQFLFVNKFYKIQWQISFE
jgi:hypothetical protein